MHARSDVEKSADSMLANGMEGKNQNQMALALQVLIPIPDSIKVYPRVYWMLLS